MSVGLIIEGGGMRGIFAAGVLDYFLDHGISFSHVMGVSMGACIGCSYVSGQRGRAYATTTDYIGTSEFGSMRSLRKTGDYFDVKFVYETIPKELYPIDNEAFRKSDIEFQTVVTNCVTGEAEYPKVEDLIADMDYVRASASLPMLARMVPIDGNVYLDGGISDSIPLRQSQKQGNEKNVLILTRPLGYRKNPRQAGMPILKRKYRRYPNLVRTISHRNRTYNQNLDYIEQEIDAGRVFAIAPMGKLAIGRIETDPNKMRKAYEEGYFVAEGLADSLRTFMQDDSD